MPKHLSGPRHLAHPKPSRRVALTVGGMLASSSAIAGASIVAVIAAGGTYAMWNDSASLDGGTIQSGSLSLTVNNVASYAIPAADWSKLLPGDVRRQEVTLTNTGTVPGDVSASTSGTYDPFLIHVAKGQCDATIGGQSLADAPVVLGVFAPGVPTTVCLQVTLPADAIGGAQGTARSFTIDFTATTRS